MGFIKHIKEEFQVIQERDPAIKTPLEVLLYPSFRVMIQQDGFLKERQENPELKFIQGHRLEKGCLLTMETVLSLERQQLLEIMLPYIRVLRLEVPEKKPENVILR